MKRAVLALFFVAADASAQHRAHVRRRFEPTDLDMRGPGASELDLQGGAIEGASSSRAIAPDIEALVGLTSNAQLQVDTTLGGDGSQSWTFGFLENTWTSLKLGIVDDDDGDDTAWAVGIQAGPKLPTIASSHGLGMEALAIVGRAGKDLHLFGQAGVLLDPFTPVPNAADVRPFGVEGGLDLDLDLDAHDRWSMKSELGGTRFFSLRTTEVHLTAGVACNVTPLLELSAIALGGLGPGDRFGVLLGAAQRLQLF